jgi:hypothetical protein
LPPTSEVLAKVYPARSYPGLFRVGWNHWSMDPLYHYFPTESMTRARHISRSHPISRSTDLYRDIRHPLPKPRSGPRYETEYFPRSSYNITVRPMIAVVGPPKHTCVMFYAHARDLCVGWSPGHCPFCAPWGNAPSTSPREVQRVFQREEYCTWGGRLVTRVRRASRPPNPLGLWPR